MCQELCSLLELQRSVSMSLVLEKFIIYQRRPRITQIIIVYLGCCHRIPQMGWFVKNRNLFLTVLQAEKSKVKAPADSISA